MFYATPSTFHAVSNTHLEHYQQGNTDAEAPKCLHVPKSQFLPSASINTAELAKPNSVLVKYFRLKKESAIGTLAVKLTKKASWWAHTLKVHCHWMQAALNRCGLRALLALIKNAKT